jgi:hypothetical protein
MRTDFPLQAFRLDHGYSFDQPLKGPGFTGENLIVGGIANDPEPAAFFLGRVAEHDRWKANVWLDLKGAHAVYVMGKRRSGKTFTLGDIAEGLVSTQWISMCKQRQAVLLLDTLNVFLGMPHAVLDVFGENSREGRELKQWGLQSEKLPLAVFYPKGSPPPPEGPAEELAIRPSDLNAEDWAALFGADTYSDPIGQLLAEVYDSVAVEGYTPRASARVPPNSSYEIADFLRCLDDNPDVGRFEQRTVEAVRRRLRALARLPIFSRSGPDLSALFAEGRISIVLLGNIDYELRGLLIGTLVKKLMQFRSISDRFERMASLYASKAATIAEKSPEEATVYREKCESFLQQAKGGLPRGWVIIDEAHNYIPARGIVASKGPLKKYVTEGRNLGLSIVVATQQPSGLDPVIQRNADILIAHSMSMRDDLQAAEGMVNTFMPDAVTCDGREKVSSRVFEQLVRSLDLGYALVSNDRMNRVFPMKVRPRITVHGGREY